MPKKHDRNPLATETGAVSVLTVNIVSYNFNLPVPGVIIELENRTTGYKATQETDENGTTVFNSVPLNDPNYVIWLSKPGYTSSGRLLYIDQLTESTTQAIMGG